MSSYLQILKTRFEAQANPAQAAPMKAYMRHQFEFLGIKGPAQKALLKQFLAEHGLPPVPELEGVVRSLWSCPEREYQYIALALLDRCQKHLTPGVVPLLEHLITTKSWWDTVDSIAIHNVGKLLRQYPSCRSTTIQRWRGSENVWLCRTTLLFQLGYKTETDRALLYSLIEQNSNSKEFFVQKAIGWALREYSKTDAIAVQNFVSRTALAPLSRREALKWLKTRETQS